MSYILYQQNISLTVTSSTVISASYASTASWANNITGSGVIGSVASALSSAVSVTATGPYYVDLSTGSTGLQASYVNTTLAYNTANNYLSATGFSGSYYGTSSWATNAITNSFGGSIPFIQAGQVTLTTQGTAAITFNKAFPNINYTVALALSGSTYLTGSRIISCATTGFTAMFNSSSGILMWHAIGTT